MVVCWGLIDKFVWSKRVLNIMLSVIVVVGISMNEYRKVRQVVGC